MTYGGVKPGPRHSAAAASLRLPRLLDVRNVRLRRRGFAHLASAADCRGLHGHSFEVEISVRSELDPERGWVMDYGDLGRAVVVKFEGPAGCGEISG